MILGRHFSEHTWTAIVAGVLLVTSIAVLSFVPVPFVTWSPGNTINVLGRIGGKNLVEIGGLPAHLVSGDLRTVSVAVSKADENVGFFAALAADLAADKDVLPRDSVYPRGRPAEEVTTDDSNKVDLNSMRAAAAGLRAANHPVSDVPLVTNVLKNGPSDGLILPGDIIRSVDDLETKTEPEVRLAVRRHKIGDTIRFRVLRSGEELWVQVVAGAAVQGVLPVVGLTIDNGYLFDAVVSFRLPKEQSSAGNGLVLALSVYGKLKKSNWDSLGIVAGSGAVQGDGTVSVVGGIAERLAAAGRAGVQIFLLPEGNCADIVTPPPGMRIIPVADVSSAVQVLADLQDPKKAALVKGCKYVR